MIRHRRDIDGLRAIAVIPVVLYHAVPSLMPGGFVGVDIFFVISGFLITSILVDQLDRGSYSLVDFYERRVRRILPALCACLACSAVAAVWLLPPTEMIDFGKSVVAVALFSANILFWRQGGYFAAPAHDKPLLHTWSLSVEEQFYVVWPLLLALIFHTRLRKRVDLILVVLGLLSLTASIWILRRDPEGAFYLAPFRAWELGLGAFLAVTKAATPSSRNLREFIAGLGLAMIVASIFVYSSDTPFPGLAALLPCVGAGLIIFAGRGGETWVGRALSLRPLVFVGLISYSLYLAHWPILVFARIGLNRDLTPEETVLAIAASFLAATLSWRYVEQPFRQRRERRLVAPLVLRNAIASLLIFVTGGLAVFISGGLPFRANAAVQRAEASVDSINPLRGKCHVDSSSSRLPALGPCITTPSVPGQYQVLVWGDSHADHFVPAIATWAGRQGFSTRQATKSACRPLLGPGKPIPELYVSDDCQAFNQAVVSEAARQHDLRMIVLSGYWASTEGENAAVGREFRSALENTVSSLRRAVGDRVQIVLIGTTPVFSFWPTTCLARAELYGGDGQGCAAAEPVNAGAANLFDPIIREVVAADENATALMPWPSLCTELRCLAVRGNTILYRDHSHFTIDGGRAVLGPLLERFDASLRKPSSAAAAPTNPGSRS